ncbi:conserved Plasmodium protein, unknown function [Plasmodium berghei]|uniref:Uncharacterized protein n=2 Tax=Plasmodium berghei TaxID=5821 RepID=A0A509AR51_PLABA|nr:conserved Plasmodium protein, unknown function [Plasmodium berghei ANKA]CXI52327.1 conserved Plasmodium protein, unknown function [Plasmodium berghei]SCL94603.1 conserved Plasmodium protein, unknown function [Plasmodium berghei]SCM16063.1 conserved Plasmodium protein, unknown function [Plasmodium berghei]SCM17858.1 conserved Plasmodium protein, unknown function [Plasmodium berghei]SCN26157.1 conserved Plasmodium protein, unknown function [Plasmodium berghei]|eukprot:XP_034421987.1 conserved Plasmodium protein, unknown function [Plasmodium berghei ANKA]
MNDEIKEDLINSLPFNFNKINFVNLENIGGGIKKNKQTNHFGDNDKIKNELNGIVSSHLYENNKNIEKNYHCYYTETSKLLNRKLDISLLKGKLKNTEDGQDYYKKWKNNEIELLGKNFKNRISRLKLCNNELDGKNKIKYEEHDEKNNENNFENIKHGSIKEGSIKFNNLLNLNKENVEKDKDIDNNLFCESDSELLNLSEQRLNFFEKWTQRWNVYQNNEKDTLSNINSLENENKKDMSISNYDNKLDRENSNPIVLIKDNDKTEIKLFDSFMDDSCNNNMETFNYNKANNKLHTYFKCLDSKQIMSNKYDHLIENDHDKKRKNNNTIISNIEQCDYKQIPENDVKEIIKNIKKRLGFFSNGENSKYKNIVDELSNSTYSQNSRIMKKKSQNKLKGDKRNNFAKKKHKKKKNKPVASKNSEKKDREVLMDSLNYSEDDKISEEEFLSFFKNSETKNENNINNKSDVDKDNQDEEVPLSDFQTYINKNETNPLFLDISSKKFKQNFMQAIRKYESDDEMSETKELEKWEMNKEDKRENLNTENDSDNNVNKKNEFNNTEEYVEERIEDTYKIHENGNVENEKKKTDPKNIITNYVNTHDCEDVTELDKSFSSADIVDAENIPKEVETVKEDNISREISSTEKNENGVLCICEILEKYKMDYLIEKTKSDENNNPNDYLSYNNYLSQLNEFISVNNYEHKNNSILSDENINVEKFSEQIDCYMHTIFDNQIKHLNGLVTDIFS